MKQDIKNYVTDFETSKQLKKHKIPQNSCFYWRNYGDNVKRYELAFTKKDFADDISAFIVPDNGMNFMRKYVSIFD